MKKPKIFKLDLHSHTSDFFHYLINNPEDEKAAVKEMLDELFKKSKKEIPLVLGIANVNNDGRYEKLIGIIKNLSDKYEIDSENEDCFISIKKNNKKIYIVKADEIETSKGHVVIIGFKGKLNSKKLPEVLKRAKKQKAIIIAAHPLHEFFVPHFVIEKVFQDDAVSLDKKTLRKYLKYFDSLEINSYFPEDKRKIKEFATSTKIPVIADSDAHYINEFFDSYFEVKNLDFRSIGRFKRTLKKALKKEIKIHASKTGFIIKYRHILSIIFYLILRKLGVIKVRNKPK